MGKRSKKVVGLKIEISREEESSKNLAIKLAYLLQKEMAAKEDARCFKEQAKNERAKAKEFSNIIVMLYEYQRRKKQAQNIGQEWNPSRMEPMETYDEDMLKEERLMLINRARDFDDLANKYEKTANESKCEIIKIQKKLIEISKGG